MSIPIYLVNLTTESYIVYLAADEEDVGYRRWLRELLTPPKKRDGNDVTCAHWSRSDRIVLAPPHLHWYVERAMGRLYL